MHLLLGVAFVLVLVVVALAVGAWLLGAGINKGVARSPESPQDSGSPGRVLQILSLEDAVAISELSSHVFFVRMREGAIDRLTRAERTFRLVDELLLELANGGFFQYFMDSAGDHAAEAVEALRVIGAARTAALVEEAWGVVGGDGRAPEREARFERMAALTEEAKFRLIGLDERFYREDDSAALLLPFVRKHQAEFLDE
jgi:hypothetical protein